MRRTKAALVLGAALVLVSSSALAAESKGDSGGKGGLGPSTPSSPIVTPVEGVLLQRNVDLANKKGEKEKPWEIGADFETHRLLRQDDLNGAASSKVFNIFGVYARYRLTEHDTVGIRDYFEERFLADNGESGVRSDDISVTYTRTVPLPRDFLFSATLALNAPTSFQSQKEGLITAPTLILGLDKKLGRYINVGAHLNGGVFIVRYASAEGGAPNPKATVSASLSAEVVMPFHEPLSFGVAATTRYLWLYNVQSSDPSVTGGGVVQDGTYNNAQPVQQSYGGEIFARYTLPQLAGVKSDLSVALAQGDPSLGYTSVLHDGVGYTYLFYRQTSEVYASFTVRY